ncbi:hypothetical protein [Paenibacillus chungangensis]|uniref:Uncharacterized protein n=1 Tax=Paenibacillus chungangensis TaxID=696535 RepID=A0ABW3HNF3_9BACL
MCRVNPGAVVPVHVVLRSISDMVQLVTIQTEQLKTCYPDHDKAKRSELTEALNTAALLQKQLVAIQEGMEEPAVRRESTITFFDVNE